MRVGGDLTMPVRWVRSTADEDDDEEATYLEATPAAGAPVAVGVGEERGEGLPDSEGAAAPPASSSIWPGNS